MITKAFSVYDSKALCYGVPFFMPSVGAAVRAFSDLCNDVQSVVNRHPADYVLYHVGTFDDAVGKLVELSPHVQLGIGVDFVVDKKLSRSSNVDKFIEDAVTKPLASVSELSNGGSL